LSLIQLLDDSRDTTGEKVAILDVLEQSEVTELFIKEIMLNPQIEKLFHNANYDLNFLGKNQAKNVRCTLEMAKSIPYYILQLPDLSLKTLAETLCHVPQVGSSYYSSSN
jgi:ribonuclease D